VKKILYFLLLLVVTNNFLIFVFGLVFSAKAANYENVQRENYILDSALTLAVQAREDNRIMPLLEAEFNMKNKTAGYSVKKLDTGGDYIKVYIKKSSEILYREYIKSAGSKPAVIPRVLPPATATPTPTEVAGTPVPAASPTRTPVVKPEFILIK
jgi:hypothetical protein